MYEEIIFYLVNPHIEESIESNKYFLTQICDPLVYK